MSATNWPILPGPGDNEDGEFGGMITGRGNRSTSRKPAPVPLCPPQIAHALTWREPGRPRWEASDWKHEPWHGLTLQDRKYTCTGHSVTILEHSFTCAQYLEKHKIYRKRLSGINVGFSYLYNFCPNMFVSYKHLWSCACKVSVFRPIWTKIWKCRYISIKLPISIFMKIQTVICGQTNEWTDR
jgi:hypothetical protein